MLSEMPRDEARAELTRAMQAAGVLADPIPADDAALAARWIDTFLEAFGTRLETVDAALDEVRALRAEAVIIPALDLERLRNRQVLFFLDAVGQYVADQPELRGLPLEHDLPEIAKEFRLSAGDGFTAVRVALTAAHDGPPLELLYPLLGHDRILMRIGAVNSHLLHGRGLEPIPFGPGGVPFRTLGPSDDAEAVETHE
jgi:glutamyl/glutaminyl-tRNA synthetase